MDNLMAAVKMAELSEVNHGKPKHTASGKGAVFFCLLLCVACSLQCWMLHLFFFACLSCAGYMLASSVLRISRVTLCVGKLQF